MDKDLKSQADRLRALHRRGEPLLLANVWDPASARAVADAGFSALATSSSAVASSLGYSDDDSMPVTEAFDAVRRVTAAVDVPVTADVEAGYGLSAQEVVHRLLGAGAVGCNLEDSDHHGPGQLVSADAQAGRIAAVKGYAVAAGVDMVVNARVDVFRGGAEQSEETLAEALRRARLYVEAGADCVYPIMLREEALIAAFVAAVDAPVNILLRGQLSVPRLTALGVQRISLGGGLHRAAIAAVAEQARALLSGRTRPPSGTPDGP